MGGGEIEEGCSRVGEKLPLAADMRRALLSSGGVASVDALLVEPATLP